MPVHAGREADEAHACVQGCRWSAPIANGLCTLEQTSRHAFALGLHQCDLLGG